MYKNIKFLLWVYVEICFTSINSTISTHAVGTVWCGVNPAAVRHHNAAADQRRCSLQSAYPLHFAIPVPTVNGVWCCDLLSWLVKSEGMDMS